MTYRDHAPGTRRVVVELIDPAVRRRALKLTAAAIVGSTFGATTGLLGPVAAATVLGAATGLSALATFGFERRLVPTTRITIDEASRQVRIDLLAPRGPAGTIAVLPLDPELRFVVTGMFVRGRRTEVVELRRGSEMVAEVMRRPDGMIASFAFAHVDGVVERLNHALREMTSSDAGEP